MVCNLLKSCSESIQHVKARQNFRGNHLKRKSDNQLQHSQAIRELPLNIPLCNNRERQKKCVEFLDNCSKPTCKERGKSYTLIQCTQVPRHEVICYHIDEGVIDDTTVTKCDYAFFLRDSPSLKHSKGTIILIELKGIDTKHAIEQLINTLHQPAFSDVWEGHRVLGRVVNTASVPKIRATDLFLDAYEEFYHLHGNLKIHEENFIETYEQLDAD